MKTHFTETDQYLLHAMPAQEKLLFEARMLTTPALQDAVNLQRSVLQFVLWYGRDLQRKKLLAIYDALGSDFHLTITSIFK